jgi:hypothetical protein
MPTYFLTNKSLLINAGGSNGWGKGEIDFAGEDRELIRNLVAERLILNCRAEVQADALDADGLSDADIEKVLAGAKVSLNLGLSGVKDAPIKGLTFSRAERLQRRVSNEPLEGKADTTDGLKKPLAAGANFVNFAVSVPLTAERIIPEMETCGGIGTYQLLDGQLSVDVGASNLSAGYALKNIQVTPEFDCRMGNGAHYGVPVAVVAEETSGTKKLDLERGLHLFADDENAALAAATISGVSVTIGGAPVDKESSPATIHRRFTRDPATSAAAREVALAVTPLFEQGPSPLMKWLTGALAITQTSAVKWAVTHGLLRVRSEDGIDKEIQEASRRANGRRVKAVSNVVAKRMGIESHVYAPFLGYTIFDELADARQFNTLPGKVSSSGSKPEPHIPETSLLPAYAARYAAEIAVSPERARNTLMELCVAFPGAYESEDGFNGPKGKVVARVEQMLREAAGIRG